MDDENTGKDEPSMDWKRLVSGTLFFFILFLSVGSSSPPDDMEQLIDAFRRAGGRSETAVLHHGNRTRNPLPREEVGDLARRLSRVTGPLSRPVGPRAGTVIAGPQRANGAKPHGSIERYQR